MEMEKLWPHVKMEVSIETRVHNENVYVLTWIFSVWRNLYQTRCAPLQSSQWNGETMKYEKYSTCIYVCIEL
jgi:hypothetical protein